MSYIHGLIDRHGVWQAERSAVQESVVDYFKHLFSSNCRLMEDFSLDDIEPAITPAMNDSLLNVFIEQEVKQAVFRFIQPQHLGRMTCHLFFFPRSFGIL